MSNIVDFPHDAGVAALGALLRARGYPEFDITQMPGGIWTITTDWRQRGHLRVTEHHLFGEGETFEAAIADAVLR